MAKFPSFDVVIASRGYHVFKETNWSNANVDHKVKVEIKTNSNSIASDPYLCVIKTKWMENRRPYSSWNLRTRLFFHQTGKW